MEIKRYKIQVVGDENYGHIADFPQMNGLISIDEVSGNASFISFDEIGEAAEHVTNIDEFVDHMKVVVAQEFTATCEVIGTYEAS